jgi:CheY-like chemotaxis protein
MEAVENGQEAVNIADSRQYDIILMDCNMPIMDGWQATEKIRQTDVSRGGVRGCWMRA